MARPPKVLVPVPLSETHKHELVTRLRRIEGQVRGLRAMVAEGRYCVEILQQISASGRALDGTARLLLRNYLETCATKALRSGDEAQATQVYDEILDLFRFSR